MFCVQYSKNCSKSSAFVSYWDRIPFSKSAWIPSSSILLVQAYPSGRTQNPLDEGHKVDLIYCVKTFDSVNHRFLLAKLKSYGIDDAVLNWIKSCLSNRSNQFQVDGVLSEEASPRFTHWPITFSVT